MSSECVESVEFGEDGLYCGWCRVMATDVPSPGFVNIPGLKQQDRRAWQRLPLAVPVFVRGIDEQGTEFLEFTATLNVSAGGILMWLRHGLARGSQVSLEIPAVRTPKPNLAARVLRHLDARVLRASESAGWHVYAFRFRRPLLALEGN